MAKDFDKECACKAADELSAEGLDKVAGGIVPPVVGSADGASDGLLDPEYCGGHDNGWKDLIK